MLAAALWLVYAVPAYLLYPMVFRLRCGFSPVVNRFPPRTRYELTDGALGVVLLVYSAWVAFGARDPGAALSLPAGLAFWALGCALRVWAIAALGPHWRMGQSETDERAELVATGPYRFMRHPINAALVLVAIGQALMLGPGPREILLLAASTLYMLVQGRVEDRRWRNDRPLTG